VRIVTVFYPDWYESFAQSARNAMIHTFVEFETRLTERTPLRADPTGRTEAAVAIVLAPTADGLLDMLLIKRAEMEGDPWSGQIAFPGGRRDAADASLLDTARRETHEELGVELPDHSLLGVLDDLAPVTSTLPPIIVRPFVFGVPERPEVTLSSEVSLHIWTSLGGLPRLAGDADVDIRGRSLRMPAYLIGDHVVWGMTHRIIKHLLDLAL
jgi:8-oxo-dGTP pyrophosphatase MutT (NUDIX family)